ncbi:22423_t:CDS:2 [Rhizophagus irregularis]|nr:22423_t:CDS:2 [Rhizophagus irregularis]
MSEESLNYNDNITELKVCIYSFDYTMMMIVEKDLIFIAKLTETTKGTLRILTIHSHTSNATIEMATNNTKYTIYTT